MTMQPRVVDIYYQDKVESFAAMRAAGVEAVIHKATQGTRFKDPLYAKRKQDAKSAGLLWGAYHFGTGAGFQSTPAFPRSSCDRADS
jgi:lysozyme